MKNYYKYRLKILIEVYKMFLNKGKIKEFSPEYLIYMYPLHPKEDTNSFIIDIVNHELLKQIVLDKDRVYE